MQNKITLKLMPLFFFIIFLGCAANTTPPVVDKNVIKTASKEFHRFDFKENQPVNTKEFVKKVDNFTVIFDPSASMTETYTPSNDCIACHTDHQHPEYAENHAVKHGGLEFADEDKRQYAMECNRCHQNLLYSKFKFAKELTKGFNQAIPDLDFTGTIRTFGYPVYTNFEYGLKENDNTKFLNYNKNEYAHAIDKILDADGVSPLAPTLKATGKDWYNHKGKIAVIIISDGKDMGEKEVLTAQDLKAKYEEDICIYTILIGKDPSGKKVMDRIAMSGQCGLAINGDDLLDKEKMVQFVHEIFLTRVQPDSDGDGVTDDRDDCPGTKPGLKVDENGCWDLVLQADVLFDFDKHILKPEGITALEQVVALLKRHSFLDLHISGHTDNFGSMKYNIKLSRQRAQTGFDYLKKRGIDSGRLSISWHSFSIPISTNDNPAGRALNRRLEFKFKKRQE
ncbi:OmpA family protein [Desulfobacula phenolica]|uniref:OmpA-OmpF porin, OOP family n=1 Tax=Desulfobacula phenolica TaxID=90732 RepID=A0A1H2DTP3_9BACT|nr:OmpA family protein [Desulfobacula phenolica]SDT86217.1 OmpA-OmpF porin, OOP family [Desulfobacula phenolica]